MATSFAHLLADPVLLAYMGMITMAVTPIYLGSWIGLNEASEADGGEGQTLSKSDAYWFPVMGSCVLFGFYLLFRYLHKDYINYLLTAYFSVLGAYSLAKVVNFALQAVVPERLYMFDFIRILIERKTTGMLTLY